MCRCVGVRHLRNVASFVECDVILSFMELNGWMDAVWEGRGVERRGRGYILDVHMDMAVFCRLDERVWCTMYVGVSGRKGWKGKGYDRGLERGDSWTSCLCTECQRDKILSSWLGTGEVLVLLLLLLLFLSWV